MPIRLFTEIKFAFFLNVNYQIRVSIKSEPVLLYNSHAYVTYIYK